MQKTKFKTVVSYNNKSRQNLTTKAFKQIKAFNINDNFLKFILNTFLNLTKNL